MSELLDVLVGACLRGERSSQAGIDDGLVLVHVVSNTTTGTAKRESWSNDERELANSLQQRYCLVPCLHRPALRRSQAWLTAARPA